MVLLLYREEVWVDDPCDAKRATPLKNAGANHAVLVEVSHGTPKGASSPSSSCLIRDSNTSHACSSSHPPSPLNPFPSQPLSPSYFLCRSVSLVTLSIPPPVLSLTMTLSISLSLSPSHSPPPTLPLPICTPINAPLAPGNQQCRLLYSYPGPWRLFLVGEDTGKRELLGSWDATPPNEEVEKAVFDKKGRPNASDRVQASAKFFQDGM